MGGLTWSDFADLDFGVGWRTACTRPRHAKAPRMPGSKPPESFHHFCVVATRPPLMTGMKSDSSSYLVALVSPLFFEIFFCLNRFKLNIYTCSYIFHVPLKPSKSTTLVLRSGLVLGKCVTSIDMVTGPGPGSKSLYSFWSCSPPMAAPGGCQVLTCFVHGFCHASILTTLSTLVYFVLFGIVLFSSYSCHAERYCKGCETRSKRPGVWTWSIWSQRLQSAMIGDVCSRCCHDLALFCPRVAFFGLLCVFK